MLKQITNTDIDRKKYIKRYNIAYIREVYGNSNYKNYKIVWLLIWAIDTLKKGNRMLARIIHHLKIKYKNHWISLAAKGILSSCS